MVSREDYAAEWQRWADEDDFKVRECLSFDRVIQVHGDVAIFIHRTVTRRTGSSGERILHERERSFSGRWRVHGWPRTSMSRRWWRHRSR